MSWIVRRMVANDIDDIVGLEQTIAEAPHWNRSAYEGCVSPDESVQPLRAVFVAEMGRCLIGFAVGKLVAGICELESIAVSEKARGQGIGRSLLDAIEEWARAEGATRIELEVRASNSGAIKLYESAGMQREGLRQRYYQSPEEDALLMGTSLMSGGKLP